MSLVYLPNAGPGASDASGSPSAPFVSSLVGSAGLAEIAAANRLRDGHFAVTDSGGSPVFWQYDANLSDFRRVSASLFASASGVTSWDQRPIGPDIADGSLLIDTETGSARIYKGWGTKPNGEYYGDYYPPELTQASEFTLAGAFNGSEVLGSLGNETLNWHSESGWTFETSASATTTEEIGDHYDFTDSGQAWFILTKDDGNVPADYGMWSCGEVWIVSVVYKRGVESVCFYEHERQGFDGIDLSALVTGYSDSVDPAFVGALSTRASDLFADPSTENIRSVESLVGRWRYIEVLTSPEHRLVRAVVDRSPVPAAWGVPAVSANSTRFAFGLSGTNNADTRILYKRHTFGLYRP